MRVFADNTEVFINALAFSIDKDPASMEGWLFLHLEHDENTTKESQNAALLQIKNSHKDTDCDVVQTADNDILFISKNISQEEIQALANEFINATSIEVDKVAKHTLYDLFRDWRQVRALLISKVGEPQNIKTQKTPYRFGEMDSLSEVFLSAKKLRNARLPLHVMVVEDDPLTRHIVANSFKENYALITAANAQEAVANYLVYAPDIVFLDIGLPDASGFDVLHQIMASDKDAYVVMFSSNSYLDNVTEALSNGASGFVSKPFKKDKMRLYIQDSALHHRKLCM